MYRRQRIIEAVLHRLERIQRVNGYETDAGRAIYNEPVNLGPDDPNEALALTPGETITTWQLEGKAKVIVLPLQVFALVRPVGAYPLLRAEAIIGDAKRAMEAPPLSLDGLCKAFRAGEVDPVDRQEGTTTLGLRVVYLATYHEQWGEPEA
jgi:hypothetical protein